MLCVLLAGGFGTRLGDIAKDRPKCLLPIKGRPILDYVFDRIQDLDIQKTYVSTNVKFAEHFKNWKNEKDIELVLEQSKDDKEKLGSIGGLDFLIKTKNIKDDLLVVAGDNLFDFDLTKFVDFFKEKKTCVVGFYKLNLDEAKKFGIGKLDQKNRLVDFEEKPEDPKSDLVSTAIYLIPKENLGFIEEYLKNDHNRDKFGDFIKWLYKKLPVYGFIFEGKWFDIGSPESYKKAEEEF